MTRLECGMLRPTRILLWRIAALLALLLAIVGVAVPVLPTVPFLILAAWAGSKSWPALEERLLTHATYGPHIRAWRDRGAVPRRAKVAATLMMAASSAGLQFMVLPRWLQLGAPLMMLSVAIWLWSRPEPLEPDRREQTENT